MLWPCLPPRQWVDLVRKALSAEIPLIRVEGLLQVCCVDCSNQKVRRSPTAILQYFLQHDKSLRRQVLNTPSEIKKVTIRIFFDGRNDNGNKFVMVLMKIMEQKKLVKGFLGEHCIDLWQGQYEDPLTSPHCQETRAARSSKPISNQRLRSSFN